MSPQEIKTKKRVEREKEDFRSTAAISALIIAVLGVARVFAPDVFDWDKIEGQSDTITGIVVNVVIPVIGGSSAIAWISSKLTGKRQMKKSSESNGGK